MSRSIRLASVKDLPKSGGKEFRVDGRRIALFNVGGRLHAIDGVCTHAEASLAEGELTGDVVACPLHFAEFNVCTGEALSPPAEEPVRCYPVRVEGDEVFIELD
jgi:3-phenylpropionate/trans-cinnamate dioxygenase ferredoxin subunit